MPSVPPPPHSTVHYYYPPFTHFLLADIARSVVMFGAAAGFILVCLTAGMRWQQQRRSASAFLAALVLAMVAFAFAGFIALGRPPIWWFIALEFAIEGLTFLALVLAVGEARRGMWAR